MTTNGSANGNGKGKGNGRSRHTEEITKVGIAIVGCGYWGKHYVRLFTELSESQVLVVCDRQQERLDDLRPRFPDVDLTTDLEGALARPDVDAVVVCTEASSHYEIARKCILAGKHVLVEKPLTTNSRDAEHLVLLCDPQLLTLMVGHTFIYNASVRKVKEYIKHEIKGIYYLYARRTNLGPIRRDVNALWDLATHDIAIFNFLLNSVPIWVNAVGVRALRNSREDAGFVTLGYPNNVVGQIHVSWADPGKAREVVVVGGDRRIVFDDMNALEQVRVYERGVQTVASEATTFGEHNMQIRDGDIVSPRIEPSEPLKNQCQHFLDCIRKHSVPLTSAWDGMQIVRIMEAIDRSIQSDGARVDIRTWTESLHSRNGEHRSLSLTWPHNTAPSPQI